MLEYAIKNILEELVKDYGITTAGPIFTTQIPGVTYTDTPISEGAVKQDQVEIKIIHQDYDEALKIRKAIKEKLNTKVTEPSLVKSGIVLRSELSGGGSLYSDGPQAWEISLILIIKWRCL